MKRLKIDRRLSVPVEGLVLKPLGETGVVLLVAGQRIELTGEAAAGIILWHEGRLQASENTVNGITVIDIMGGYEALGGLREFQRETESEELELPILTLPAVLDLPSVQKRVLTGSGPVLREDLLADIEAGKDVYGGKRK